MDGICSDRGMKLEGSQDLKKNEPKLIIPVKSVLLGFIFRTSSKACNKN